jgi:hypothetical protein
MQRFLPMISAEGSSRPKDRSSLRFKCSSVPELKPVDRLPVHDLSAVNAHSLRFEYSATPWPARNGLVNRGIAESWHNAFGLERFLKRVDLNFPTREKQRRTRQGDSRALTTLLDVQQFSWPRDRLK